MTQSSHAIQQRKKILIADVPGISKAFASYVHRWGYEPIVAYNSDINAFLEIISRGKIDLLIVAKELTLKGPSLSDDWKKGDEMKVDSDFGFQVLNQLRVKKNNLPVILLTTEMLTQSKWVRGDDRNLNWVEMMKVSHDVHNIYDDLKKAIAEFLGTGLSIHEWARVFIVDDEIEICLNMKDMFGFEDYNADYATTAKEAFQKMDSNCYDLLLCDIKLEGRVSGIDIIKNFREKERRPKIIVISAIPRDALDPTFQKEGVMDLVDGYLDKPSCSNPENLMRMVRRVLDKGIGMSDAK